jgi:hypothetical protein
MAAGTVVRMREAGTVVRMREAGAAANSREVGVAVRSREARAAVSSREAGTVMRMREAGAALRMRKEHWRMLSKVPRKEPSVAVNTSTEAFQKEAPKARIWLNPNKIFWLRNSK